MNVIRRSVISLWKQIRPYSSKSKNHYEALGVSTTSTQNEIKKAYYKLSMMYHPDKNEGNAQKFRDITEAYEVLGNVRNRKLYDKGLLIHFPSSTTVDPSLDRFYKSRQFRSRPPPPSGRTPIYDFDEWSKQHYGRMFHQQQENKRRSKDYKEGMQREMDAVKIDRIMLGLLFLLVLSTLFTKKNYDEVVLGKRYAPIKD